MSKNPFTPLPEVLFRCLGGVTRCLCLSMASAHSVCLPVLTPPPQPPTPPPGLIPGPGPGMYSSCLSAVSSVSWFCGGPGAQPKGGRSRAVPSIRLHSTSRDCIFHTKSECRWFHSTVCFCETAKGCIQLRGFPIRHVSGASLRSASSPFSALASSLVKPGTEG